MNIHDAIMKAADQIEQDPGSFNFLQIRLPSPGCGSPGCALGWIGHFVTGRQSHHGATFLVPNLIGEQSDTSFYAKMDKLVDRHWRYSASECALGLRLYARKYHAPTKRTDSELVADLMQKVMGERIPEEA